jgi:hypothetical protein
MRTRLDPWKDLGSYARDARQVSESLETLSHAVQDAEDAVRAARQVFRPEWPRPAKDTLLKAYMPLRTAVERGKLIDSTSGAQLLSLPLYYNDDHVFSRARKLAEEHRRTLTEADALRKSISLATVGSGEQVSKALDLTEAFDLPTSPDLSALSRAELERINTEILDRAAFGFVRDDVIEVPLEKLHVRYAGDLEGAEDDVRTPAMARRVLSKAPPIAVSLRNGRLDIEDGHHRFVAARILGRSTLLAVVQEIHDNPIDAILKRRSVLHESRPTTEPNIVQADPDEFHDAFERAMGPHNPFTAFVTHYSVTELQAMQALLLSQTGTAGVAVHDHGDGRIEGTALFSTAKDGMGRRLLAYVVDHESVNYLECLGEGLKTLYERNGFTVQTVSPFSEEFAPPNWNYRQFGKPNYYTMFNDFKTPRTEEERRAAVRELCEADPATLRAELRRVIARDNPYMTPEQVDTELEVAGMTLGF